MAIAVNERSPLVSAMAIEWPMLEALMAGTRAMRAAGETYLPKFANEHGSSYDRRLKAATLFPAFRRTVRVMAGKPFAQALSLADAPPQIEQWAEDIDLQGTNLHTFAGDLLTNALAFGIGGILVEAPRPIVAGNRVPTLAEERAAGVRPYFVRIRHDQILGFRLSMANGRKYVSQLRLAELSSEPDGDFGEVVRERVRVLEPGSWRLFEKQKGADGKDNWILIDEGATSLGYVPFVPVYGERIDHMVGRSPLLDLAYLNVKHWQSQSDQDNILSIARVPILAAIGADEGSELVVGASSFVRLPQGGDLKFVEHSGAAISAGASSIEALEEQMIQAGAELLVKRAGDRSATEAANDAEGNKSDLQRIAEAFEDALDQALQIMADYARLGSGGSVNLFKDYGASTLSEASGQLVVSLYKEGVISHSTTIAELKRRGELAAEVDPEAEELAVATERQGMEPEEPIDPITGQTLA